MSMQAGRGGTGFSLGDFLRRGMLNSAPGPRGPIGGERGNIRAPNMGGFMGGLMQQPPIQGPPMQGPPAPPPMTEQPATQLDVPPPDFGPPPASLADEVNATYAGAPDPVQSAPTAPQTPGPGAGVPAQPPAPGAPVDDPYAGLPPEVISQIVAMGGLAEDKEYARMLQSTPTPEGRQTSRLYVAANPLEHLGAALRRHRGNKQVKDISGKQAAGRQTWADALLKRKEAPVQPYMRPPPWID